MDKIDQVEAPQRALILQFLAWVAGDSRSYGEAMEAWRTNCPRLTVWEDAFDEGLVRLERGGRGSMRQAKLVLTPRGRAVLEESAAERG